MKYFNHLFKLYALQSKTSQISENIHQFLSGKVICFFTKSPRTPVTLITLQILKTKNKTTTLKTTNRRMQTKRKIAPSRVWDELGTIAAEQRDDLRSRFM